MLTFDLVKLTAVKLVLGGLDIVPSTYVHPLPPDPLGPWLAGRRGTQTSNKKGTLGTPVTWGGGHRSWLTPK